MNYVSPRFRVLGRLRKGGWKRRILTAIIIQIDCAARLPLCASSLLTGSTKAFMNSNGTATAHGYHGVNLQS